MNHRCLLACLVAVMLAACQQRGDPQATAASNLWLADVGLPGYLDCAREADLTLLQAHRAGDRSGAAENSLRAIEASLEDGAVFMELDVALTADGELILMHDETVDRTTTGSGRVEDMTAEAITALELVDRFDRPTGERVPTFADALDALAGRGVAQVDLKGDLTFDRVAAALEDADAVGRAIVITYTLDDAIALHQRLPAVMLSVGIESIDDLRELDRAGVDRTRLTAWLGLGHGKPTLDSELAALGIETSYGDFAAEIAGSVDYERMAANGAEVISVDDVRAASEALESAATVRALVGRCAAAGAPQR